MADPTATQQEIIQFRARIMAGEALTEDELRSAWAAYRQKRQSAAEMTVNARRGGKVAAPMRSANELANLFAAPATTTTLRQ